MGRIAFIFCLGIFMGSIFEGLAKGKEILRDSSDQQLVGFSLSGFGKQGKKTWEVKGESADIFTDVVKLRNIIADLYGEEDTTLTADQGLYDKVNSKVHLQDNVVAITSTGSRLTTDSLDWDINNQTLTTSDVVKVERQGLETTGKGGWAQTAMKKVELKEEVMVKVEEKERTETVITCDGPLEVDYQNYIATFHENVHVTDSNGEVFADFMEVYFSPVDRDNMRIDKIIAKGGVRILRGENTSFSEEAEYLTKEGKLILKGSPKLMIYSPKDLGVE